jgi:hypothetical protein
MIAPTASIGGSPPLAVPSVRASIRWPCRASKSSIGGKVKGELGVTRSVNCGEVGSMSGASRALVISATFNHRPSGAMSSDRYDSKRAGRSHSGRASGQRRRPVPRLRMAVTEHAHLARRSERVTNASASATAHAAPPCRRSRDLALYLLESAGRSTAPTGAGGESLPIAAPAVPASILQSSAWLAFKFPRVRAHRRDAVVHLLRPGRNPFVRVLD